VITREKQPPNLEMPFGSLGDFITPTENFFVRCHFPIPQIAEQDWRLRLEGFVTDASRFSLADLRALPTETLTATIECAGNSRVFLLPKVKGVQWELGAVGNADWTGVRLHHLLHKAQVRSGAREVVLEGADKGSIAEPPRPAGEIHFARSVPLAKAMDDVLLAFEMNGRPLTPAHGFPLRAIVPGWYGMASVKWLRRIIITDQTFQGYYQTVDYAYWRRDESGPNLVPLAEMQPKAEISRPQANEIIPAGTIYEIAGAAWAGEAEISKVELSFDSGRSWLLATLNDKAGKNTWRRWRLPWKSPEPGRYTLMARATDGSGRTQALERNADASTYMIDHCLPIEVEVH
jgi:DMSO/TMAO reductase YedYZ molybdopterin-dependent catalytic subunit